LRPIKLRVAQAVIVKPMKGQRNLVSIKGMGPRAAAILLSIIGQNGDFGIVPLSNTEERLGVWGCPEFRPG
jgi:hypothetical protein